MPDGVAQRNVRLNRGSPMLNSLPYLMVLLSSTTCPSPNIDVHGVKELF